MKFGVIIPTRNRPALFNQALESVLMQRDASFEVVVVNDGSDEACLHDYRAIEQSAGARARFIYLPRTKRGHGQSHALNFGVAGVDCDYVCFLDDDDFWTDPTHLARAEQVIAGAERSVDVYLANQQAFNNGAYVGTSVWLENLIERIGASAVADPRGAYTVTVEDLFKCDNFGHLNTTVVRRPYFLEIGGLDENIRYENDRDFFLRVIDRARLIKYHPAVVSRHNIPDQTRRDNMSTVVSNLEKRLDQLRVLDKAVLFASQPAVRAHGKEHKVYALKKIAEQCAQDGRLDVASHYARQALLIGFGWKWAAYTLWLAARNLAYRPRREPPA